jgi:carbamoyl-phosphate synthase large subunit
VPKRRDLSKILIIGAGPIIIGQACEFDYSGTQACKALKEEGYEVILINSNPATIMTDPDFANETYIEPITPDYVKRIIEIEKPDAILPTMGGQTSLNTAVALAKDGTLNKYGVELIGAKLEAIEIAEDRDKFKQLMHRSGLQTAKSAIAHSLQDAKAITDEIGFPLIIRPAFTLGGYGGGIVYNYEELDSSIAKGLAASPTRQVLIEQSLIGWKEIEFEVMRDLKDNVVIICAIENLDPMGVHTGDSITVAPTQTLSDKEYQALRDASIKVIRAVGVETGGSNIQFALNPENGDIIVIEMNPRVSRSSALASKATGFPIAKIAAKLAVGYTLDEIPNDITKKTMASFEPSIDYVVTKIPRFAFEKFPGNKDELSTQMKSVGETMAIGRSFKESFQKALRSLENRGSLGFINSDLINKEIGIDSIKALQDEVRKHISTPSSTRIIKIFDAFYLGLTIGEIHNITKIDPWFLAHLKEIVQDTKELLESPKLDADILKDLKSKGFSDKQLALILKTSEDEVFKLREKFKIHPVYKTIDTCAGEFESFTPYHYSSYEEEDEIQKSGKPKVFILGGGPNRIGQGIEFDYCCVHAVQALREAGYETVMINNNPETVSTDFDISDKLYFEPVTVEDIYEIWRKEQAVNGKEKTLGMIVQLGGQTPLNICRELEARGITIIGTKPEKIDLAEDRDRFGKLISYLGRPEFKQTQNAIANSITEAKELAEQIGYPLVLRPSYVLGGRGMEIVHNSEEMNIWLSRTILEEKQLPILLDKFLDSAVEIDVDAISDGTDTVIAGIMEHIEYAGIHSGDSASVYPPQNLSANIITQIEYSTRELARVLQVKGLMNIQFAVKDDELYMLEINPRASRTVPFISKATGIAWAKLASLIMIGKTLKELKVHDLISNIPQNYVAVKEAVFSFNKFDKTPVFLGPEMRSTGEVMGISHSFAMAFAKAQIAASLNLPENGKIFVSFNDRDKHQGTELVRELIGLGYQIVSTSGTAQVLISKGLEVEIVKKVSEGRPNIADLLKNGEIKLILNIPYGKEAYEDSEIISKIALTNNMAVVTTLSGSFATVKALSILRNEPAIVKSIQKFYEKSRKINILREKNSVTQVT